MSITSWDNETPSLYRCDMCRRESWDQRLPDEWVQIAGRPDDMQVCDECTEAVVAAAKCNTDDWQDGDGVRRALISRWTATAFAQPEDALKNEWRHSPMHGAPNHSETPNSSPP